MDTAIVVAILAAAISVIGWIANYILTGLADRRTQKLSASLKHIEQQLEELYGPLAILLLEGRSTFNDLCETLGRNFIFIEGQDLPDDELKIWLFWVENDLFPRNEKIKTLLMTKTHLIEGERLPESYLAFLDHFNSWKISHLRWQKEGVKYSWHSKVNWPREFEPDVISAFDKLKVEHAMLIGRTHKANLSSDAA